MRHHDYEAMGVQTDVPGERAEQFTLTICLCARVFELDKVIKMKEEVKEST